jgi:hypothetical protein
MRVEQQLHLKCFYFIIRIVYMGYDYRSMWRVDHFARRSSEPNNKALVLSMFLRLNLSPRIEHRKNEVPSLHLIDKILFWDIFASFLHAWCPVYVFRFFISTEYKYICMFMMYYVSKSSLYLFEY